MRDHADGLRAEEAPHDDPALELLADAILDGVPIDWEAARSGSGGRYLEELRALADLGAVHRSLPVPGDSTPALPGAATSDGGLGQWGPLRLLERIGEGAFGEVFRAWDTRLDREVALKLLRHHHAPEAGDETNGIAEGGL